VWLSHNVIPLLLLLLLIPLVVLYLSLPRAQSLLPWNIPTTTFDRVESILLHNKPNVGGLGQWSLGQWNQICDACSSLQASSWLGVRFRL